MVSFKRTSARFSKAALLAASLLFGLTSGASMAQNAPAVSDSDISAARSRSERLSREQRDQAQDHFKDAFDLYRAGQYEQARRAFLSGLAIDPANAAAHFYLGEALSGLGDRGAALESYRKAVAFDPASDVGRRAEAVLRSLAVTAAAPSALKPGDSFKDCNECPEMTVIPSGSFNMGTEKEEPGHYDNEVPKRSVTIAKNFSVGKFAVTFEEWDACKADGGCNGYSPPDNNWGRGKQPVIFISWNNAKDYTAWLSRKSGKAYRLLSEAEREYVTRAGTTTPFWWGAQISPALANYDGTFAFLSGPKGEFRDRPLPVDSFSPNPWGLYQVHGNVLEWVEDCAVDDNWKSYSNVPTDGSPYLSKDCKAHMQRGGAWDDLPRMLRSSTRRNAFHSQRNYAFGFRVARDLSP